MPKTHLRQPGRIYSAFGPFTKNNRRVQKFWKAEDSRCIYQNVVDKACFQQDMADGNFKDLPRRTASDEIMRDKAFNIAKNPKFDGYQIGLASMVYKLFNHMSASLAWSETLATRDKSASGSGVKNENISKQELAKELHKPIIRKFEKHKVHLL